MLNLLLEECKMASFFLFLVQFIALTFSTDPMENDSRYEGDMQLNARQYIAIKNGNSNRRIPLGATKTGHWPRKIPYVIAPELKNEKRFMSSFYAAIADYHKHTCLRFHKRRSEKGYMYFFKETGCWAQVGYANTKRKLSLSDGCWTKGIVMHEIAHSLGFYHEQSRPDRDRYVKIHPENVKDGKLHNFQKHSYKTIDSLGSPYDFDSLMHYKKTSFSRNGKDTIEVLVKGKSIGQRRGFSVLDSDQMNKLYRCGKVNPLTTTRPRTQKPTMKPTTSKPKSIWAYACRGKYFFKRCLNGQKMRIDYVHYGYISKSIWNKELISCNNGRSISTRCQSRSSTAYRVLKSSCNWSSRCVIKADDKRLGKPKITSTRYGKCSKEINMLAVRYRCI